MTVPSSPARRIRRYAAGASLALFPALLIPQALVDPAQGGTGEVFFRAATESRGALVTSALLLMLSGALMIPAVGGVLHQARDRGAALADVGAVLFVLGGLAHLLMGMFSLSTTALAGGAADQMAAFVDRFNDSAVLAAIGIPLILCFGLGVITLPWAAWRAGAVHVSVPAVVTVAVLAQMALPSTDVSTTAVLVVLTAAYGLLGSRVLAMTDAEWDGVRPATRRQETALPA